MATLAQLICILATCAPAASLRLAAGVRPAVSSATRTPPARAALSDSVAVALPAASQLLAADDVFGEVFMAGMSIAFAAVGATVLVGVVINGKYDEIEKSMFAAQDEATRREAMQSTEKSSTAVSDFFGEPVPSESSREADASSESGAAPRV